MTFFGKVPDKLQPTVLPFPMGYSAFAEGEVWTAAQHNALLRDNLWDRLMDQPEPIVPKARCGYCTGLTLDDARGNCAACGGPRD